MFETGLAGLAAYIEAEGHARVPYYHVTPDGFKLGTWCASLRNKRRAGHVSVERVAALDALGFMWQMSRATTAR